MEFLSQQNVDYISKDIRADREALNELLALEAQSTPTLVIGDEVLIGFRSDKIQESLLRNGLLGAR